MEYYELGKDIIAFTTDRTVGRDAARLSEALNLEGLKLLYPHQTHTDRVFQITEDFLALPLVEQKPLLEGVDAVIYQNNKPEEIVNCKSHALAISTADCIPVIVYDKEHHAAAAIHAGWKGTVLRIVEKAVRMMQEAYGTYAFDCTAAIGPGISQESFEVGWEVVEKFKAAGFNMEHYTKLYPASPNYSPSPNGEGRGGAPHIDLKEINRQQLLSCGVKAENIFVSPIDTFTDERFFSARREQKGDVKCGRILSGFLLL